MVASTKVKAIGMFAYYMKAIKRAHKILGQRVNSPYYQASFGYKLPFKAQIIRDILVVSVIPFTCGKDLKNSIKKQLRIYRKSSPTTENANTISTLRYSKVLHRKSKENR